MRARRDRIKIAMSESIVKPLVIAIAGWALPSLALFAFPAGNLDCGRTAYDCALYYVKREDFQSAIRSLQQLLNRQPRNLKALNLMGIALTGSGQIERANQQFRRALKINPRFHPALKNLATNELTLKQTADAKRHFEQVLDYAPEDEVANLSLAEIHFGQQACVSAWPHYEKARMRIVNNRELILHYGQCALEAGRRQAAITMLDLLPTTDAEGQFQAGLLLGRKEAYGEAAKYFGRARQPGFPDLYVAGYNQVLMLVKAGDYPAAIRAATELITQGHEQGELDSLLAEAYLKSDRIKEAYDSLRRATQLEPEQENNYLDLAAICVDYANYDLGLEITEVGLHYIPNSYRLRVERGVMHAMKGQLVEAEKDLSEVAMVAPQEALPYVGLGIAWMQMGKNQQAIDMLRERVRASPSDYMLAYLLGEALVRSGPQPDSPMEREAVEAFETSIRLNPNYVDSRTQLGKILLRRGELDRALAELEKAVALGPTEAGPAFLLAQACRRKGDQARAEELFARARRLQTEDRDGLTDKDKWRFRRIVRESMPAFSSGRPNP